MSTPAERTFNAQPDRPALPRPDARRAPDAREADHRLANSLQLAANFLLLQQARLADPVARWALINAAERLVAVGHLHRFLCDDDGAGADVDLQPFLRDLAALLEQGTGLRCAARSPSIRVPASMAQQLGLAVNELAMNAAKHAYDRSEAGDLMIEASRAGDELRIVVSDHGRGLGAAYDVRRPTGLGTDILQAIARQLAGRLEAADDGGARFTLAVPLPAGPARPSRSFAPPR